MHEHILYTLAGIGALTSIIAIGWGLFWCIHEYIIDPYHAQRRSEILLKNSKLKDTINHLSYLLNKSDMKDMWAEELHKMREGE